VLGWNKKVEITINFAARKTGNADILIRVVEVSYAK
jgi:hypothetical protein